MVIKSIQKVIKVGDSRGIILPAKELDRLGVDVGSELKVTAEPAKKPDKQAKLKSEYDAFVSQYGQTLKKLKDR